jgi:DNA-binding NtrC family response regulator
MVSLNGMEEPYGFRARSVKEALLRFGYRQRSRVKEMKILVVDDDAIVIKSCRRILEAEGFEVTTVPGADEALEKVKYYDFDLLLMDVKMPKHDGIFLMREIKKNWPNIPIIVMSGYPTPETIADVLKLGATQFIPKPFRPDELTKVVRQVLQKAVKKDSFPTGAGG